MTIYINRTFEAINFYIKIVDLYTFDLLNETVNI